MYCEPPGSIMTDPVRSASSSTAANRSRAFDTVYRLIMYIYNFSGTPSGAIGTTATTVRANAPSPAILSGHHFLSLTGGRTFSSIQSSVRFGGLFT